MLVGHNPTPLMSIGSDVLKSITLVGFTTSSSSSISWPAGRQADDLAVMVDMAFQSASYPNYVTPSGFTIIQSNGDQDSLFYARFRISYKKLLGSESGTLTGMSVGGEEGSDTRKVLAIWRPSWNWSFGSHIGTSFTFRVNANPAARSVSVGVNAAPLIALGFKHTSNTGSLSISPGPADFQSDTGSARGIMFAKFMLNAGEEVTQSFDCGQDGTNNLLGTTLFSLT